MNLYSKKVNPLKGGIQVSAWTLDIYTQIGGTIISSHNDKAYCER